GPWSLTVLSEAISISDSVAVSYDDEFVFFSAHETVEASNASGSNNAIAFFMFSPFGMFETISDIVIIKSIS
ncbi:hypothetical protein, partial [Ruminococcus flavefaciens]|uniref:hypothetical protein n=1 Tax=Ruminococcus flavefaciens TaxID=1265 RepID=UPI0026EB4509